MDKKGINKKHKREIRVDEYINNIAKTAVVLCKNNSGPRVF